MDPADTRSSMPTVKLHPYEDPELQFQIKQAQESLRKIHMTRAPILQELDFKKMDLEKLSDISSYWSNNGWWDLYMEDLDLLQSFLAKLSFLDDCEEQIRELKRQLIHDQTPRRAKETKIFKKLNDSTRTRGIYMGDSSIAKENAEIIERWGSKDNIRQRIEECELGITYSRLFVSETAIMIQRKVDVFKGRRHQLKKMCEHWRGS